MVELKQMETTAAGKANMELYRDIGGSIQAGGKGIIGLSIADSYNTLVKTRSTLQGTPRGELAKVILLAGESVRDTDEFKAAGTAAKQNELITNGAQAAVLKQVTQFTKNPEAAGSFFALPSLSNIVAATKGTAQNLSIYKTVLEPMLANQTTAGVPTIASLNAQLDEAIKSGTVNEELAVREMHYLITSGVALNNINKNFTTFGMLPQTTYLASHEDRGFLYNLTVGSGSYSKGVGFNVMDINQFIKYRAADKARIATRVLTGTGTTHIPSLFGDK
jgi:hypothetical protein